MLDKNSVCRTCMNKICLNKSKSYNIYATAGLCDKLMQCSNMIILANDEYPPNICNTCRMCILEMCDFQELCWKSLENYKKILKQEKEGINVQINSFENVSNTVEVITEMVTARILLEHEVFADKNRIKTAPDNDPLRVKDDIVIKEAIHMARVEEKASLAIYDHNYAHTLENPSLFAKMEYESESEEPSPNKNNQPIVTSVNNSISAVNSTNRAKPLDDKGHMKNNEIEEKKKSFPENVNAMSTLQIDELFENGEEHLLQVSLHNKKYDENISSCGKEIGRFKCDLCTRSFLLEASLLAHQRKHLGVHKHTCPRENCEQRFKNLEELRIHLNDHDGIPSYIYKCTEENCGMECTSRYGLKLHTKREHNLGPTLPEHVCETCGATFMSLKQLKIHQYLHVDESLWPFKCEVEGCGKSFRNKNNYAIHKNRHDGIKPYACTMCDMRFCASTNLNSHMNHHTREKKWLCQYCSKVFYVPANLRLHIRLVHEKSNATSFPCRFCKKYLSTASQRTEHERQHTGEKPFICDECGLAYRLLKSLEQHKEIHDTGEKPYNCDKCGRIFKLFANLKRHMIKHKPKKIRKYDCSFCSKSLQSSQSLKFHKMIHTGEKPYSCESCGVQFRYQSNMTRHIREDKCGKIRSRDSSNLPVNDEEHTAPDV